MQEVILETITADNVDIQSKYTIINVTRGQVNTPKGMKHTLVLEFTDKTKAYLNPTSKKNIIKKLGYITGKWRNKQVYPKEIKEYNNRRYIIWDLVA